MGVSTEHWVSGNLESSSGSSDSLGTLTSRSL